MVEYNVKDIHLLVDGVEITNLAEGGDTGITPSGDQMDNIVEALDGEVGWERSPNTQAEGTIEVLKSSPQVGYLIELAATKKEVKISFISDNPEATGFSEITLEHAKIGFPETKITRGMETFAFPFKGFGFDFRT